MSGGSTTVLSGAALVLPDGILAPGTITIEGGRIVDLRPGSTPWASRSPIGALEAHYIVPGFIDLHLHGVAGVDALDAGDPVALLAARLPGFGVTAFCPTTVACTPDALRRVLEQVRRARQTVEPRSARVLQAHLESNFIDPAYCGAQPAECLRIPRAALAVLGGARRATDLSSPGFSGADILREIEQGAQEVGMVTLAPELDGGLDLIAWLSARGLRVSLGHSAATYDEARAAIAAGARHATHLFNRMPPLQHRAPGLSGAILESDSVVAELICDGVHVHPAMARAAIRLKSPSRVCAISDATAGAGLPVGSRVSLGGRPITVGEKTALLDDGTLAGSVTTIDRMFRTLVTDVGVSMVDAAVMCSTTPARELGLADRGIIARGAAADLVVLDDRLAVVATYVGGELAYARGAHEDSAGSRGRS